MTVLLGKFMRNFFCQAWLGLSVPIANLLNPKNFSNVCDEMKSGMSNDSLPSSRLLTLLCVTIPVTTLTMTKISPPIHCAASQSFSQSPVQTCVRSATACQGRARPAPLCTARSPPQLREETSFSLISDTAASTNYLPPFP